MAEEEQSERLQMRVSPRFLRTIDDWRRAQSDLPSRAEAIRRLVEQALGARAKPTTRKSPADRAAGAARAEEHASAEISRRQRGSSQTEGEQASRKRRLLKGPPEFERPGKPK